MDTETLPSSEELDRTRGAVARPLGLLLPALALLAQAGSLLVALVALLGPWTSPWQFLLPDPEVRTRLLGLSMVALAALVTAVGLWHVRRWSFTAYLVWVGAVMVSNWQQGAFALGPKGSDAWIELSIVLAVVVAILVGFAVWIRRALRAAPVPGRRQLVVWAAQFAVLSLGGYGGYLYAKLPARHFTVAGERFPIPSGCEANQSQLSCPHSTLSWMIHSPGYLPNLLEDERRSLDSYFWAEPQRFSVLGTEVSGYRLLRLPTPTASTASVSGFLIPVVLNGKGIVFRCFSCRDEVAFPQDCRVIASAEGFPEVSRGKARPGSVLPANEIRTVARLDELEPWCGLQSTGALPGRTGLRLGKMQAERWDAGASVILAEELSKLDASRTAKWRYVFRNRAGTKWLAMVVSGHGIEDVAEKSVPPLVLATWPGLTGWNVEATSLQDTSYELLVDPPGTHRRRVVGVLHGEPASVWLDQKPSMLPRV